MQTDATNVVTPAPSEKVATPRWIHVVAVLTVLAAFPLLFLGAEVTTKGVGMVDPKGFRWPWEVVAILSDADNWANIGLVTELTHRLFGFLVGVLGILLCVALLALQQGPRKWLGVAVLGMVIVQGLLGRYRVDLNALLGPTLAWVHGSFAPLVFATLVSVALVTSRGWSVGQAARLPGVGQANRLPYMALAMVAVVYGQLVLGGMVRHQQSLPAARGHLLGAFVATAGLLWLVWLTRELDVCRWSRRLILALLGVQILLGVEAWFSWMRRLYVPLAGLEESTALHWLRSGHYVVGTLLFATTVVLMLQVLRSTRTAEATA